MEGPNPTILSVFLSSRTGPNSLLPVSCQNQAQWSLQASFPKACVQRRLITRRLTKIRTNGSIFSLACLLDLFQKGVSIGK